MHCQASLAPENKKKHTTQNIKKADETYRLKIIIPMSSLSTPSPTTLSSNGSITLLAVSGAEVGTIGTFSALCDRLRRLLLQHLHLVVKLGRQLFVLVRELANPILRYPVVPTRFRHVVRKVLHIAEWARHFGTVSRGWRWYEECLCMVWVRLNSRAVET